VRVGDHEVVREIGRGGMGVVYLARGADGREVAIKVLTTPSGETLPRFEREARLHASLGEEEGFVPLLATGTNPPRIVMPFVSGGTLRDLLDRRHTLAIEETVELGLTLARALGRAHALGIVHRDVKPENVLFGAPVSQTGLPGRPLLADLGLAKHFSEHGASVSLSRTGEMRGTAAYMAPEQAGAAKHVGPAADVYALGAVLYECLTGAPLHEAPTLIALLAAVESGAFEPIAKRRPEAPRWLVEVVERALARDPAARLTDGVALARALASGKRGGRSRLALLLGGAALVAVAVFLASFASSVTSPPSHPAAAPSPPAPPAAPPTAPSELEQLLDRANELTRARDFRGAATILDRAVALDPESAQAFDLRGYARFCLGEFAAAKKDATRAMELKPSLVTAWGTRADSEMQAKEWDAAIADYTHTLELTPGAAKPHFGRGSCFAAKGNLRLAVVDYDRALELDPNLLDVLFERGRIRKEKLDDPEGALADFERFLEIAPNEPDAPKVREWRDELRSKQK
jgi:serine/threonine protein kinase